VTGWPEVSGWLEAGWPKVLAVALLCCITCGDPTGVLSMPSGSVWENATVITGKITRPAMPMATALMIDFPLLISFWFFILIL